MKSCELYESTSKEDLLIHVLYYDTKLKKLNKLIKNKRPLMCMYSTLLQVSTIANKKMPSYSCKVT